MNAHNFLNIYRNILMLQLKTIVLIQGIQLKKNFCSSTSKFSQLLKMLHILTLILYITIQNENIIPTNMCYDKIDIFIQNLQEIGASTLSKM